jgi:hypothetical protein
VDLEAGVAENTLFPSSALKMETSVYRVCEGIILKKNHFLRVSQSRNTMFVLIFLSVWIQTACLCIYWGEKNCNKFTLEAFSGVEQPVAPSKCRDSTLNQVTTASFHILSNLFLIGYSVIPRYVGCSEPLAASLEITNKQINTFS